MKTLGYYNGKFDEIEKMQIPMLDRVCSFGDGVYDVTYARNHKIFTLEEHMDRFFASAEQLDIRLPHDKEGMKYLLQEMVNLCDDGNLVICWQATRGTQVRSHAYPYDMIANIWITIRPCDIVDMTEKIDLITVEDTRYLHCNIKTLNLIPNVMASQRALKEGVHEALFHRGERVTECAHSNVHIIKDGVLLTPPADCYILKGVARDNLIKACQNLNIPVNIRPFTVQEIFSADEVIITSSGSLCLQVGKVDGIEVGGKAEDIIKKLQAYLLDEFLKATE
ncbi:MAG: D-amino acid aminotransferase [Clostridia bacterium]|nr:D-amino acid aminotransferase [Clostridia bacterium]